jgi:hypothetical protein
MPAQHDSNPPRDTRARGTRRAPGTRTRWFPVEQLSPLARALLNDDLGGRDVVPQHVADRVTAQATRWAEHGFTAKTVRPWRETIPAAASYLAERGVDPAVLDLPVNPLRGGGGLTLQTAIATGQMPVERAYELLVLTGHHTPPRPSGTTDEPSESSDGPPMSPARPRPVAPVIFSHATPNQG